MSYSDGNDVLKIVKLTALNADSEDNAITVTVTVKGNLRYRQFLLKHNIVHNSTVKMLKIRSDF